jgi:hypothetical protein
MLLLLLQAAQQAPALARQAPPQVYVTVQQPRGGMPEWLTILITATVGALVGIVSNIAMEYVKPYIATSLLRKTVITQLSAELMKNMSSVGAGRRVLEGAESKSVEEREYALSVARVLAAHVKHDRFDFYFTNEKSVVYEIDEADILGTVYTLTNQVLELFREDKHYESAKRAFVMADGLGKGFIELNELAYEPTESVVEKAYNQASAARAKDAPEPR